MLFIALTLVAFFLFEVLRGLCLHPVQYLLVGLALCSFYWHCPNRSALARRTRWEPQQRSRWGVAMPRLHWRSGVRDLSWVVFSP